MVNEKDRSIEGKIVELPSKRYLGTPYILNYKNSGGISGAYLGHIWGHIWGHHT
ncbi:MAG TPA: hypothetical protein VMW72_04295 [Sedimentisphaerales bacterium]|nr:hypothetical protein [Sedimentisphaerales bacterium]